MSDAKKTASKKTASSKPEDNRTDSVTPDEVKEAMAERATSGLRSSRDKDVTTADLNPAFNIVEEGQGQDADDDEDDDA